MAKATLTPAQVRSQVNGYVSALKSEGKSTVKRVRIVGTLADAQVGTQSHIASLLVDGIKSAGLSVNLDTARAQVGHAVTAYKLLQRFALIDSDEAVTAAVSVCSGNGIKSADRDDKFKGISSEDMTADRFVAMCAELKTVRKLKSAKPAPKTETEKPAEGSADDAETVEHDADVSLVADAQKVLSQFAAILKLAQGDDADAILSLFTEFSETILG